uniref:RING-type domain-containing protein n=1 Tax=Caenorhabditis tropicalis TaxID=1561998 RepID=A0A1I7UN74_9PELO
MITCGDVYFSSLTSYYCTIHLATSVILGLLGVLYLVFAEISINNFIYAGGTLFTCIIIGLVFRMIHSMIWCCHKVAKIKQLRKCKNLMIVGLVSMMVFGHAPKIWIFFIGYDYYVFWSISIICFMGVFLSYYVFIDGAPCEVLYRTEPSKLYKSTLYLHVVALVALCRVATTYSDIKDTIAIIGVQVVFCPGCMFAYYDLYKVLIGEIRVKHPTVNNHNPNIGVVGNAQVQPAPRPRAETTEKAEQKIECKICLLEYSEIHVPRIMKECGHTVCENCADNLLNYSNKKYMICPFCQMVTVVKGPASLLPKNYGIMDVLDSIKDK